MPHLPLWSKKVRKKDSTTQRIRIEGVEEAPLTPVADEAENAAHALLDTLSGRKRKESRKKPDRNSVAFYRATAARVKGKKSEEVRDACRYVAYVERMLALPGIASVGSGTSLTSLEEGLYAHMDAVNREGGELKVRWQDCLAELIVRKLEI